MTTPASRQTITFETNPARRRLLIMGQDDVTPSITIRTDGHVELNPDISLDEASQAFWQAVERVFPNYIATALAKTGGGWMPIETAPHSKAVLIFVPMADQPKNLPRGVTRTAYQTEPAPPLAQTWRYAEGVGQGQQCGWPTHWQQLPTAPAPPSDGVNTR